MPWSMGRQAGLLFEVDEDRCFGCAACVALCPVNALTLEGLLAIVDEPSCTHCEHCIPACPVHALSLVRDEKTPVYGVLALTEWLFSGTTSHPYLEPITLSI